MPHERVLEYWFGPIGPDGLVRPERSARWFTKSEETDLEIGQLFAEEMAEASRGALGWAEASPRACLSLIIVLDQFPRNVYRGTPKAFAHDGEALRFCLEAMALGWDKELQPIERVFFYMPMQHAENLEVQQRGAATFDELRKGSVGRLREFLDSTHDFAVRHRQIIERFGRFPHRNTILGRRSTPQETEFLLQPGSSF